MKENPAIMKILFTGFESFGKWSTNPTEVAVNELNGLISNGIQIVGKVIPLRYAEIGIKLQEYVKQLNPIAMVISGQAGGSEIRLERLAKNFVQTRIPYNCGSEFTGNEIVIDGPEKLYSTLPLDTIISNLLEVSIPVRNSDDAGSFGCNQIFYIARQMYPSIPCGFIHVPLLPSQVENDDNPNMSQEMITQGLKTAILSIINNVQS